MDYNWQVIAVNEVGNGKAGKQSTTVRTEPKRPFVNPDPTSVRFEVQKNKNGKLTPEVTMKLTFDRIEPRNYNGDEFAYHVKYCIDTGYWRRVAGEDADISGKKDEPYSS